MKDVDRLPEGWRAVRLRYLADIRSSNVDKKSYEDGESVRLCNYVDVYHNEYITSDMDLMRATATEREIERFALRRGDVIITKDSESRDDIGIPACVSEDLTGVVCGYHLALLRPLDTLYGPYLLRALRAPSVLQQLYESARGITRFGLSLSSIGDLEIPLPPLDEQRAIAADLDRETARLDALTEAKGRLLERLAARRQSLVTRAVTRGLDPDVALKDSGVDWLGEVPAHWTVPRLKHIAEVRGGVTKGRKLDASETVSVPYLRVANVQDGYIDLRHVSTIDVLPPDVKRYGLVRGDVLMNEGGDRDKLGRGAVWDGQIDPCLHQNHVFAVRCSTVDPEWLSAFTGSGPAKAYFEMSAKRSTNLASISATSIRNLSVPLPPEAEQVTILSHIARETASLDALAAATRQSVTRLGDRRAALIAETVTGRRRVLQTA